MREQTLAHMEATIAARYRRHWRVATSVYVGVMTDVHETEGSTLSVAKPIQCASRSSVPVYSITCLQRSESGAQQKVAHCRSRSAKDCRRMSRAFNPAVM